MVPGKDGSWEYIYRDWRKEEEEINKLDDLDDLEEVEMKSPQLSGDTAMIVRLKSSKAVENL